MKNDLQEIKKYDYTRTFTGWQYVDEFGIIRFCSEPFPEKIEKHKCKYISKYTQEFK